MLPLWNLLSRDLTNLEHMTDRDGKSSDFHIDRPSRSEYICEESMIYAYVDENKNYIYSIQIEY